MNNSDTNPTRILNLVYSHRKKLVSILLAFVAISIPQDLHQDSKDIFANVQTSALHCLTRFVSICSYESHQGDLDYYTR